jgi:acrylyl-CoA reductase (NADPH)
MAFNAIVLRTNEKGDVNSSIEKLVDDQLPSGTVTVSIQHSTVNYKDGLCFQANNGLVKSYPHVPGIDFAGIVESSADERFAPGDIVVLTGWRVGEIHWGGLAQKARVPADWLVPLPSTLNTRHAMAIGTAGVAAMLAITALEDHGLRPENGEVLVTGAAGGVGSIATAILAKLGYQVAAVTGRKEASDYLIGLGASRIVARSDLDTTVAKPLESEIWAGCVDAVGGNMLARILGQMKYGASVSAVGLAGGAKMPASVVPFLLRGINLLGIDSVMQPYEKRVQCWRRLASDLPIEILESLVEDVSLQDVPVIAQAIINGQVKGRIVVDVNALHSE